MYEIRIIYLLSGCYLGIYLTVKTCSSDQQTRIRPYDCHPWNEPSSKGVENIKYILIFLIFNILVDLINLKSQNMHIVLH